MAGGGQKRVFQPVEFTQFLIRALQFAVEAGVFACGLRLFVQAAEQARVGGADQADEQEEERGAPYQQRPLPIGNEAAIPGGADGCPDAEQAGDAAHKGAKIEQPGWGDQLFAPLCQEVAETPEQDG